MASCRASGSPSLSRGMAAKQTLLGLLFIATLVMGGDYAGGTAEWGGIFEVPTSGSNYVWTAQKVNGAYADATMKLAIITTSEATSTALTSSESTATTAFAGSSTAVTVGSSAMTPSSTSHYTLTFDTALDTSLFPIDTATSGSTNIAIWAQHVPTEFERTTGDSGRHYLQDSAGADVEPAAELPEASSSSTSKPWGKMFGATFLVCLVTLIGVFFAIPLFKQFLEADREMFLAFANAFAAGALLAAAFYLMLYEAVHLAVWGEEAVSTAYWGSAIILGFMTSWIVDLTMAFIFIWAGIRTWDEVEGEEQEKPKAQDADAWLEAENGITLEAPEKPSDGASSAPNGAHSAVVAQGSGNGAPEDETDDEAPVIDPKNSNQIRVLSGILVGDFMHNLVDGIVIGAAFVGCSDGTAWGITGATVAHEIAQEIADYFVLTDPKHGNLKPWMALLLNFLSGLSCVLGGIIIVAQGEISNKAEGLLLAYGGGVYVQMAATECLPRAYKCAKTMNVKLLALFFFILGAVCIGVILESHEHCVPDTSSGHAH